MKKSELRQLVREELKSILSESPRYASPGSYTQADSPQEVRSLMKQRRIERYPGRLGFEKTDDGKLPANWRDRNGKLVYVQSKKYPSGLVYYRISFYD